MTKQQRLALIRELCAKDEGQTLLVSEADLQEEIGIMECRPDPAEADEFQSFFIGLVYEGCQ